MADNKNKISGSQYDIYSKLMDLAGKYTDIQNEDFLRTGAMGYLTESMAMMIRDSSIQKTMLYNESFLNTARMSRSVYNWAKMFNIKIEESVPAYTDIMVTIPISDLDEPIMVKGKHYSGRNQAEVSSYGEDFVLVLDRKNPFIVGNLTYHMEKSVIIYTGENTGYNIKYLEQEIPTTSFYNPDSLEIKGSESMTDGQTYLSFIVRAYQYNVDENIKQVASSSFLDTKHHKFEFDGQFVGARLFYRTGSSERTEIDLRYSGVETLLIDTDDAFGYYNIVDGEYMEVSFSSQVGKFMPVANSLLEVEIYTTEGAKGNISYSGEVIYVPSEDRMKRLPLLASLYTETSQGGIDTPGIDSIKNKIINAISTRDVIVTESDLNSYFLTLTSMLGTINNGEVRFIKKRDDLLKRLFSSYILMRDDLFVDRDGVVTRTEAAGPVIPTNTIDIIIPPAPPAEEGGSVSPRTNNFSLSAGATIAMNYDKETGSIKYVQGAISGQDEHYVLPFFTYVNLKPFKKVKYVYNLTNDSSTLVTHGESSGSGGAIVFPSTIEVLRTVNSTGTPEDHYTVSVLMNSNFDLMNSISETDEIGVKIFGRSSSVIERFSKQYSYNSQDGYTLDEISSSSGVYNYRMEFKIDVAGDEFGLAEGTDSTGLYGSYIYVTDGNTSASIPSEVMLEVSFNDYSSRNIKRTFRSADYMTLFQNLDDIMFSDIETDEILEFYESRVFELEEVQGAGTQYKIFNEGSYLSYDTVTDITSTKSQATLKKSEFPTDEGITIPIFDTFEPTSAQLRDYIQNAQDPQNIDKLNVLNEIAPGYYPYLLKVEELEETTYFLKIVGSTHMIGGIELKEVPVIHSSYYINKAIQGESDESSHKSLINQIFIYIKMLRENLGKLETNTFFDLKFFNTRGVSQYYNTPSTDIDLKMTIHVRGLSESLRSRIQESTRILVDETNENNFFDVSRIITLLRASFPEIRYIDFKSLTGSFTQEISFDREIPDYAFAPEYINIQPDKLQKGIEVVESRH